jgi:hypothetical protein
MGIPSHPLQYFCPQIFNNTLLPSQLPQQIHFQNPFFAHHFLQ